MTMFGVQGRLHVVMGIISEVRSPCSRVVACGSPRAWGCYGVGVWCTSHCGRTATIMRARVQHGTAPPRKTYF